MKPLHGKRILITAGPTWEMIDPVRFLTNRSSGLMGFEIAAAAAKMGAKVTLITGPTSIRYRLPNGDRPSLGTGYLTVVPVVTALEMARACMKYFPKSDIAILTAAVSDYRPAKTAKQKIKKGPKTVTLKLVKNPDILAALGKQKKKSQFLVGFALESQNILGYATDKLHRKSCDIIVANSIPALGSKTNTAVILTSSGNQKKIPKMSKKRLANVLLKFIAQGSS